MTTPSARALRWEVRAVHALEAQGVEAVPLRYARRSGGEATGWRFTPQGTVRARLIYAHGTGNDALYPQVGLIAAMASAQVEVVVFDLDGHGRDASTTLTTAGASQAFDDAERASSRPESIAPLYFGGQSLGGALALKAAKASTAVRGVLAFAAPSRLGAAPGTPWILHEATSALRPAVWRQLAHYGPWGILPALGPLKRGLYPIRTEAHANADGTTSTDASSFAYVETVSRLVASLDLAATPSSTEARSNPPPALLIYGSRDKIVPAAEGERIASHWPNARVMTVRGATHFSLPFERAALDAAVGFLTRTPP